MYVTVYIIRKPEYEDAQVLGYTIPKEEMLVVSGAIAHMDKCKWKLRMMNEHIVEKSWADRFLNLDCNTPQFPPPQPPVETALPWTAQVAHLPWLLYPVLTHRSPNFLSMATVELGLLSVTVFISV